MAEKTVNASEFARHFGRYRDEVATGNIVNVAVRGRVVGGFLSAEQIDEYRRLKQRHGDAYRVEDLPDDLAQELEDGLRTAEYGT
ncbi:MAG: hypothetical protein GVY28_02820 [Alphaproteobacteria bacterium]|jgi:antitoxin (DNA-binding transcriptional repressor) of toxin-antitoxin stability system|nr:hypothetical protein [Alphaproteobacteria bacterium]